MTLVDSSILIQFLRKPAANLETRLHDPSCRVCGVNLAELLHGTRSNEQRTQLIRFYKKFTEVPITTDTWTLLGDHLRTLRSAGLPMPFQDVLLATVAIEHAFTLWTRDLHFAHIAQSLSSLKLQLET